MNAPGALPPICSRATKHCMVAISIAKLPKLLKPRQEKPRRKRSEGKRHEIVFEFLPAYRALEHPLRPKVDAIVWRPSMQDTVPVADRPLSPASTVRVAMHPIHPMLVPFPFACFTGALITDVAYWKTAEMMWADFSAWLLFAELVMGVLAALAGSHRLSQQPADPPFVIRVASYGRERGRVGPRAIQLVRP